MSETRELLAKTKEGDSLARSTLVEENLKLVHHVVKRFAGRGFDLQDLFQIGTIGLMKAVDNFDLSREVCFSTYAVPMIMGEIRRFIRDDGMIRVSRSLKENAYRIQMAAEKFRQQHGRDACVSELSELTGLSGYDILEATEACREVESIYKPVCTGEGSDLYLVDILGSEEDEKEELLNHMVLEQLLGQLEEEERNLILFRYMHNMTQVQVAERLGMSQVQVSRCEKRVLLKLRKAYFGEILKK
ncbi:MAG: SigB/SigF/SigG family RNA polymerase sigma factor [Lachnospiraceae bacterium]|nr:SigB/SigF/SigG family RNA polymerase sigma factor [Lachnospiraceae bacterium]